MVDHLQPDTNPLHGDKHYRFLYLAKREKLTRTLEDPKIKTILGVALTIFPSLVAGALLYMWLTL
jgi:hypothetical protein